MKKKITRLQRETAELQDSIKYLKTLGYKVGWDYFPNKENSIMTTCRITKEDEEHKGISNRNPKDSVNLKLARYISFQRTIMDIKL